jgi:hypothetical protein
VFRMSAGRQSTPRGSRWCEAFDRSWVKLTRRTSLARVRRPATQTDLVGLTTFLTRTHEGPRDVNARRGRLILGTGGPGQEPRRATAARTHRPPTDITQEASGQHEALRGGSEPSTTDAHSGRLSRSRPELSLPWAPGLHNVSYATLRKCLENTGCGCFVDGQAVQVRLPNP